MYQSDNTIHYITQIAFKKFRMHLKVQSKLSVTQNGIIDFKKIFIHQKQKLMI
jgi:hypothetical protein